MHPRLQYSSEGRGGSVIYQDAVSTIRFYYEFGGGNCVAIIFIPGVATWVNETGRSLEERDAILQFVADRCLKDQVSSGYVTISDQFIELFTNRS